jgi:hypothetical protein
LPIRQQVDFQTCWKYQRRSTILIRDIKLSVSSARRAVSLTRSVRLYSSMTQKSTQAPHLACTCACQDGKLCHHYCRCQQSYSLHKRRYSNSVRSRQHNEVKVRFPRALWSCDWQPRSGPKMAILNSFCHFGTEGFGTTGTSAHAATHAARCQWHLTVDCVPLLDSINR